MLARRIFQQLVPVAERLNAAPAFDHKQHNRTGAASAETQDRTGELQIFSLWVSQLSYHGHIIRNVSRPALQELGIYLEV